MWRVAITAPDVVAPVFAAAEVVVLFFAGVAGKTGLSNFFGRFVLEGDDLGGIALGNVGLARPVTGLTTRHLSLPTAYFGKLGMRSVRERFELIFVAVFTGFAADVVGILEGWGGWDGCAETRRATTYRLGLFCRREPQHQAQYRTTDEQCLD